MYSTHSAGYYSSFNNKYLGTKSSLQPVEFEQSKCHKAFLPFWVSLIIDVGSEVPPKNTDRPGFFRVMICTQVDRGVFGRFMDFREPDRTEQIITKHELVTSKLNQRDTGLSR